MSYYLFFFAMAFICASVIANFNATIYFIDDYATCAPKCKRQEWWGEHLFLFLVWPLCCLSRTENEMMHFSPKMKLLCISLAHFLKTSSSEMQSLIFLLNISSGNKHEGTQYDCIFHQMCL